MVVPWQEVAKRVQGVRDASIAAVEPPVPDVPKDLPLNVTGIPKDLLTAEEVQITETSPELLLKALASGKWSSVKVTTAFLRRAGLAQKLTNCVTELLPALALYRAKFCDQYLEDYGRPIGILHGLPISVKELVGFRGLKQNSSFVGWADEVAPADAQILALLSDAGAVFHARTTCPQILMHLETSSNLYGVTVNGYNRNLTAGGSSGGEGALVGMRGSCLGIGTDIGGSIRVPAANNGVWGYRPTSKRLPLGGCKAPMAGSEHILPVIGPISTSLEGCKLFTRAILEQQPWLDDPSLVPMKWNTSESFLTKSDGQKKLKVAVEFSDGVVKPHPPVIRALNEMVAKLKNVRDIEVVEWEPLKHDIAWDIISSLYFCDGGKQERAAMELGQEPMLPLTRFILEQPGVPKDGEDTASTIWQKTIRREQFRAEYAALWNSTGDVGDRVDVILCPAGPGAAPPLEKSRYWTYSAVWNLLDYPAITFPVTTVDPEKDKVEHGYVPMNVQDEENYKLYSPEKYVDAPVALQLVARRYEDEKLFEAMEFIKNVADL